MKEEAVLKTMVNYASMAIKWVGRKKCKPEISEESQLQGQMWEPVEHTEKDHLDHRGRKHAKTEEGQGKGTETFSTESKV